LLDKLLQKQITLKRQVSQLHNDKKRIPRTIIILLTRLMMAELGALANLAAVVGVGLRLSMELYTISAALKDAGKDIRSFSSDVALHCKVLKQVQKTLDQAKGCRVSNNAIQTAQHALDESEFIFAEVEVVIARFQKRDGKAGTDVLTRMKWLYQKPTIKWLQESLGAIRGHLHLMLTTLTYGELLAASSGQAAQKQDVALEAQLITIHSMYLAQHDAATRLGRIEDLLLFQQTILSENCMNVDTNSYSYQSPVRDSNPLLQPPQKVLGVADMNRQSRLSTARTSVFLNTELSLNTECSGDLLRGSNADSQVIVMRVSRLLEYWTDQQEPLDVVLQSGASAEPAPHGTSNPQAAIVSQSISQSKISSKRNDGTTSSNKEKRRTEPRPGYFDGSVQTCRDVIRTLLREKGTEDQLPYYAIYIVGSGQERCLKMEERPREILERLRAAGTYTKLTVRKRRPDEDINPPTF
jgi:hypothetical protein